MPHRHSRRQWRLAGQAQPSVRAGPRRRWPNGGADVAIGLAVDDKSFAAAYGGLRRGGRLVLVALPAAGTLRIPVFDTVLNGTSVIGSIVGTRADLRDVFALHASGQTRVIYQTRPLAAVNDSIREVLRGQAKARIVMTP